MPPPNNIQQATTYDGPTGFVPPVLMRASVAQILGCTPLTLRNREDKGLYPEPTRHPENKYRIYTIADVFNLQQITYDCVYFAPILSILYDKGYVKTTDDDEEVQKKIVILQDYLEWCLKIHKLHLLAIEGGQMLTKESDVAE